jgi:hypothetical protein|tara:strand:- start:25 stop:399 length:375 start_codon:yes stop_codon:yes gene_type:complete
MIPDPGVHFIVKDWGINPYDPPQTFKGLTDLSNKELKRMLKAMVELPTEHPIMGISGDKEGVIIQLMGVIYFNNNTALYEEDSLDNLVKGYTRPTRLLNWSDHRLVDFMRKQGKFIARIDYKKV